MSGAFVDLSRPLPRDGLHLIEASAGTGKTYTLEALVARYIVETDIPISAVLLVTFTNDAANELRQRVRRRLSGLSRLMERGSSAGDRLEPIEELVVGGSDPARTQRRLAAAIRDFDQATITTIHAFAQQLLRQAGLDHNPTVRLRTDVGTVAVDVVADELARRALIPRDPESATPPSPSLTDVVNGLKLVRNRPGLTVLPRESDRRRLRNIELLLRQYDRGDQPTPGELASYDVGGPFKKVEDLVKRHEALLKAVEQADVVRTTSRRLSDELLRRNEIGFSEVLTEAESLVRGSPRVAWDIRSRYRLVLIDEFQDTDQVQWSLLSHLFVDAPIDERDTAPLAATDLNEPLRLFAVDTFTPPDSVPDGADDNDEDRAVPAGHDRARAVPSHVTVLVGDPKQAIYGFRGGDIQTYRTAAATAGDNKSSLDVNWRSQRTLVEGLNELFQDSEFGPGITYQPVEANRPPQELSGHAIEVRTWEHADFKTVAQRRAMIADDLAHVVQDLVEREQTTYGQIAVLYTSHLNGPGILRALQARGVPAVITRGETVFNTAALGWWRRLLWALEKPTDPTRARNAMIAPIIGLHPDELVDEHTVRQAQTDLVTLATMLSSRGVAAAARLLLRDWQASTRLLRRTDGERSLVDIEHIAELLHLETHGRPVSATAARELLEELALADPDDANFAAELARRRLDTEADDNVVRIMSIHAAKGLEFDVVLCPTLFENPPMRAPYRYNVAAEEAADLDLPVGTSILRFGKSELAPDAWQLAKWELADEQRRLAYVALTRARDRLVVWWPNNAAPRSKTADGGSGLAKLLLARGEALGLGGNREPVSVFRAVADRVPHAVAVQTVTPRGERPQAPGLVAVDSQTPELVARSFTRAVDRSAGRLSFTGITRVAFPYEEHGPAPHLSASPELADDAGALDENPDEILDPADEVRPEDEVPLAALPAGREAGTRLHTVFERADFNADGADLTRQLDELIDESFPDLDPNVQRRIVEGVQGSADVPLGSAVHHLRLADVPLADRLDELHFDLPLRTGRETAATLVDLGALIERHLDHESEHQELIAEWAQLLRQPDRVVHLGGFLTGSIDLFFRHASPDGQTRYVVADYKSNKVARWPEAMTPHVYRSARLGAEMLEGQYLLQALLYLLAAHRFLEHRVQGYDPDVHLGPALYLFVRGMTGDLDDAGHPHGVFSWRPSTPLLLAVDELLLRPRAGSVA